MPANFTPKQDPLVAATRNSALVFCGKYENGALFASALVGGVFQELLDIRKSWRPAFRQMVDDAALKGVLD